MKQILKVGQSKVKQEASTTYDRNQSQSDSEAIAIAVTKNASCHKTKDLSDQSTVGKSRLPGGRDFVRAIWLQHTIFFLESG